MSSNIRVTRICEYCGKAFEARTTVTKTCSDNCAKRSYKNRQRLAKVEVSNTQVVKIKAKPIEDLRQQEYLTVNESAKLLRISRRTLYRMNERDELPFTKLSRRTVIRRADVDKLFERPATAQLPPVTAPLALSYCYTLTEVKQKYGVSDKALHDLIRRNGIAKQYRGKNAYVSKAIIDALFTATPIQP